MQIEVIFATLRFCTQRRFVSPNKETTLEQQQYLESLITCASFSGIEKI